MLPERHRRTEAVAIELAVAYEVSCGRRLVSTQDGSYPREVLDQVLVWGTERGAGCVRALSSDFASFTPEGSLDRLIEVKGRGSQALDVSVMDRQLATAQSLGPRWWLYVAFDCATPAPFLVVVEDPQRLPWERIATETGEPGARVGSVRAERRWHVGAQEVIAAGQRVTVSA